MSILIVLFSVIVTIIFMAIFIIIIIYFSEKMNSKIKYIEYEYPGRNRCEIRNRTSERAIASFKDLYFDKKKHFCYKIFITTNKIYVILYHHYFPPQGPGPSPYLITIFEPIFNFIFKNQIEDLTRYLDRGSLEKTKNIEKLIYKSFHFYELDRSTVEFNISNSKLTLINRGQFKYGRRGTNPDDLIIEQLRDNMVQFRFDSKYNNDYSNLIHEYFKKKS